MSAAATLLERLEMLIREESRRQREHLERQWSLPLEERVRKGYALKGLSYVGTNERTGNLVFKCMTNQARFREGDYLFLHKSHPLLESQFQIWP